MIWRGLFDDVGGKSVKTYDVKCPICGKVNHNLYLDDTGGWMECEGCGQMTQYLRDSKVGQIPPLAVNGLDRKMVLACSAH